MATRTLAAPARVQGGPHPDAPQVLAIVVTHDGRRWLKDCLVALNAQSYPLLDVLVVDDASPDWRQQPHLRRVVKRHIRLRRWGFLRGPRPLGFGGAINWALSRTRTRADLLLFMHDDVALDRTSVERMVARLLSDDNIAIVGPKVVSWEDPSKLEEVGMAIDRLGYPYKGLEQGEIDLGQHDVATEVFFVTSTCMLMRHDVFRRMRGWDARMRAFSEDLDLCWRARIAGHLVVVEPAARGRHAIALATGQRRSRFTPTRYYIRRNRLRTVAKNVSTLRLLALVPLFVLLSFSEMLGFVILRQPAQIASLARALAWNLFAAPQTLSERLRVQRARTVADRRLRRLTVRAATRVRAYIFNQAERLEQAWGRSTELVAERSTRAAALSRNVGGWQVGAALVAVLGLGLGLRHVIWGPPIAVGELLPFPSGATGLWRAFWSPWRAAGLGQPGPAPPAFALLGLFPALTLGATALAQKLLLATLGVLAFWGAYRLVSEVVDRPARLVSSLVYALGAVGYAGLREGALGALVLGALAPWVLHNLLGVTGWVGRGRPDGGRGVARMAVGTALCGAFVPGSVAMLGAMAVVLAGLRLVLGPRARSLRGLLTAALGIALGWVLLLPWSATWLRPGGALASLRAASVAGDGLEGGLIGILAGQTPRGPVALGAALPLLAGLAALLSAGQRRRLTLALLAVVVTCGWLHAAGGAGLLPRLTSTTEAGVIPAAAFAGLAGLAVGAFRLDLPRRRLGLVHAGAVAGLLGAAALIAVGLAPALVAGGWAPGRGARGIDPVSAAQVDSLLEAESVDRDPFRVLWVGPGWTPTPGGSSVAGPLVTGARGRRLTDLFARQQGRGAGELSSVVDSVESGALDVAGHALGTFNIRYVVLERGPGAHRWLSQRDLALIRSEPDFVLLQNGAELRRAAVYDRLPRYVRVLAANDESLAFGPEGSVEFTIRQRSPSKYEASSVAGPGTLWLAENADEGWSASVGGEPLERREAGWGNAFEIPEGLAGPFEMGFHRGGAEIAGLLALALCWIVAAGAAAWGIGTRPEAGSA